MIVSIAKTRKLRLNGLSPWTTITWLDFYKFHKCEFLLWIKHIVPFCRLEIKDQQEPWVVSYPGSIWISVYVILHSNLFPIFLCFSNGGSLSCVFSFKNMSFFTGFLKRGHYYGLNYIPLKIPTEVLQDLRTGLCFGAGPLKRYFR